MTMLRFIFALAVHTATTSAVTVSVKDGADEGHRQLGTSDCRQREGHDPSAGSCCNFCDNPGNGVDKPWWRPAANAKCDRDDLACSGCSQCTTNCRQREGHDQSAGSCCNFCDNPGNGVDKPWTVGANAKCHRDDIACSGCSQCDGCRQDVKSQGEDINLWRSRVHERQLAPLSPFCTPTCRLRGVCSGCPHGPGKPPQPGAQSHDLCAMLTIAHTFACAVAPSCRPAPPATTSTRPTLAASAENATGNVPTRAWNLPSGVLIAREPTRVFRLTW